MNDNNNTEKDLQNILASGWVSMFIIFLANLTLDMVRCFAGYHTPYYLYKYDCGCGEMGSF